MSLINKIQQLPIKAEDLKIGDLIVNKEDYYLELILDIKENVNNNSLELYVIDDNGNEPILIVPKSSITYIIPRSFISKM